MPSTLHLLQRSLPGSVPLAPSGRADDAPAFLSVQPTSQHTPADAMQGANGGVSSSDDGVGAPSEAPTHLPEVLDLDEPHSVKRLKPAQRSAAAVPASVLPPRVDTATVQCAWLSACLAAGLPVAAAAASQWPAAVGLVDHAVASQLPSSEVEAKCVVPGATAEGVWAAGCGIIVK